MTAFPNLEIAPLERCCRCRGHGELIGGVCSIPWHPPEKTKTCPDCEGTGLNEPTRKALKKAEQAEARKATREKGKK